MTTTFARQWVPAIAFRQAGLFKSRQACAAGMTYAQVRRRRDNGTWTRVVGDALAPATLPITAWTRAQAAALTWPDAVVCLASAAAVHRLPVPIDPNVHVSVPDHRPGRLRLVAHQLQLPAADVGRAGLALLTTQRRTLFDCIGRLESRSAESLMIWAITRELLTGNELRDAVAARPKWWGNRQRRTAADDAAHGALGAAERKLHAILRTARITGWRADQKVYDLDGLIGRADVLFDAERVVVEIDGMAYHGAESFQSDRTRQNRLVNAGYIVLRFTWADVTDRPEEVIRQIRLALARATSGSSRASGSR